MLLCYHINLVKLEMLLTLQDSWNDLQFRMERVYIRLTNILIYALKYTPSLL